MLSIKPAPNKGVGIRKLRFAVLLKSGCSTAQSKASVRPLTVKRGSTTPASADPTLVFGRTARTGPSGFRKPGIALRAPWALAILNCGFCLGLDPPGAGQAWQPPQLVPLKRGPRSTPGSRSPAMECTSWKAERMLEKYRESTPATAVPALVAPGRTPGSYVRTGVSAGLLKQVAAQATARGIHLLPSGALIAFSNHRCMFHSSGIMADYLRHRGSIQNSYQRNLSPN